MASPVLRQPAGNVKTDTARTTGDNVGSVRTENVAWFMRRVDLWKDG